MKLINTEETILKLNSMNRKQLKENSEELKDYFFVCDAIIIAPNRLKYDEDCPYGCFDLYLIDYSVDKIYRAEQRADSMTFDNLWRIKMDIMYASKLQRFWVPWQRLLVSTYVSSNDISIYNEELWIRKHWEKLNW